MPPRRPSKSPMDFGDILRDLFGGGKGGGWLDKIFPPESVRAKHSRRGTAKTGDLVSKLGELLSKAGFGGLGGKVSDVGKAFEVAGSNPATMWLEIAKKVKEKIDLMVSSTGKAFGEVGKAFKSERAGEAAGHLFGTGEQMGKMMGGPHGKALETVSKFGRALAESVDKLRDWTQTLHDSNMRFAEFSSAMAGVAARQFARDINLSRDRGQRRGASAEALAKGKTELEKQLTPWEDALANLKNYLGGAVSQQLADILKMTNQIYDRLPEWVKGGPKDDTELHEALFKLGNMHPDFDSYGRPKNIP